MSGNQSDSSGQNSPSLLSGLERFKCSPKISISDYFSKTSSTASPASSPLLESQCNGIENLISEKKLSENHGVDRKPEIINGHIKEEHKTSYDKDSPDNRNEDLAMETHSSNEHHSDDKNEDSLKSSNDQRKEVHKSTLDKLKEFRKNARNKHKESQRSSSTEHEEFPEISSEISGKIREDSSKSSSDKHKNSVEKLKEFRKHSSDKSDKTSENSSYSKCSDQKNLSARKIETISDSDSNSSDKHEAREKFLSTSLKKLETISDSDNTPVKDSPSKQKDSLRSPVASDAESPIKKYKPPEKLTYMDVFLSSINSQQQTSNPQSSSQSNYVEAPAKKRRKVRINDDSDEEEAPKSSKKKRRRVAVESVSDSDEEASKSSRNSEKQLQKKKRRERESEESDVETDSDAEYQPTCSASQAKILSFISSSPISDLKQVPSMTQRKIDIITAKRPYSSWLDMINHLKSSSVQLGLLDNVSELLKAREVFSKLIKKVNEISRNTQMTIKSSEGKMKKQPSLLNPELQLSDYQLIGVNWLAVLHSLDMGGILADEMGLGKTVQVISFLAHLKEKRLVKHPHLIIVPSSTLANWENEFRRWCPSIGFQTYHGSMEDRREMRYVWNKEGFSSTEVVLSTYSGVCNNFEDAKFFRVTQFHYVVFDEAHMLKNMNTQRYSRLFLIKAMHRLLLTGTPLQNNLLELMSLLNFTMPGVFTENLGSIKFLFGKQTKPITDDSPDFEKEKVDQVKKIIEPFVLRRLKSNVLKDLPKKDVSVIKCPMLPDQAAEYKELLTEFQNTESFDNLYMTMVMSLRKMANHPLMLRYHYDDTKIREMAECLALDPDYKDTNVEYIVQDLVFLSDFELHQLTDNFKCLRYERFKLSESLFLQSGKFRKLDELLPDLKRDGHRVLIFSQFLMLLDLIGKYLSAKGHTFRRLDGSTPVQERQMLIDDFNKDPSIFCFLLSTKAGGLGINLTAADTVIIHDIDINPYNDKQAEDRCHRVGQKRPVTVFKFISENTMEEDLYKVTQNKLNLEQEVTREVDEAAEKETLAALLRKALGLSTDNKTADQS